MTCTEKLRTDLLWWPRPINYKYNSYQYWRLVDADIGTIHRYAGRGFQTVHQNLYVSDCGEVAFFNYWNQFNVVRNRKGILRQTHVAFVRRQSAPILRKDEEEDKEEKNTVTFKQEVPRLHVDLEPFLSDRKNAVRNNIYNTIVIIYKH